MTRLLIALVASVHAVGVASAADTPISSPGPFANICNAYGEGYHLVPGTLTCVKIGGSVTVTVSVGSGSPSPDTGAGKPPAPH